MKTMLLNKREEKLKEFGKIVTYNSSLFVIAKYSALEYTKQKYEKFKDTISMRMILDIVAAGKEEKIEVLEVNKKYLQINDVKIKIFYEEDYRLFKHFLNRTRSKEGTVIIQDDKKDWYRLIRVSIKIKNYTFHIKTIDR